MMLFLLNWRISLSLPQTFIHIIRDPQFPTTSILKNQNLKLNENRFQELVQNCGMRYQLSSEHYQNSSLLKRKIRMILFNILESGDSCSQHIWVANLNWLYNLICFRIYLSIYWLVVFTKYFPLLFTDYPGQPRLTLLPVEQGQ